MSHNSVSINVANDNISRTLALLPYAKQLGIRLVEGHSASGRVFHLPFEPRLVGNMALPAFHGGVIASFMEVAALSTTYSLLSKDRPPKLVDFSIDYLSSAGPHDLFAACEMQRIGKRIAAVGIRCWQRDRGTPVALGRAHIFIAHSAADSLVF